MKNPFLTIFLTLCAVLCIGRVVLLSLYFASHSLQLDFSAFYTAGEALNHGFSPYNNNINQNPSIWDGRNQFEYSRFLYPPLTATFFRGIALLPYSVAKFVWVTFILICLVVSIFIFSKIFRMTRTLEVNWFVVIIFTCLFFPLLPFIERGQIDSVTLLVLCVAFYFMLKKEDKGLFAGLLFALATLLKLNCIFLVPFFFLRKRFDVFLGYAAGGVLLILASVVFNGFDITVHYITSDFPRISLYGEDGYSDQIFVSDRYPQEGIGPYTIKQGKVYSLSLQDFDGKPNLVQPIEGLYSKSKNAPSMSLVSLVIFGIIFVIIAFREIYLFKRKKTFKIHDEFLFWQLALLVIILASPLTWVMNLVWLCPLIFYALYYYKRRSELNNLQSFYWLVTGLLLVALPDRANFPFTLFDSETNIVINILVNCIWANKYQIGEIMLTLFCLVEYVKPSKGPIPAPTSSAYLEGGLEDRCHEESLPSPKLPQIVPARYQPLRLFQQILRVLLKLKKRFENVVARPFG